MSLSNFGENQFSARSSDEEQDSQDDMFRSKVNLLWQEKCLIDVSLACENEVLTAHKLVLSAYSDYFKDMFASMLNVNQYPIIFMRDISSDILHAILEFMYRGEVNVPQDSLHLFMRTARSLKVKGINISDDFIRDTESQLRKRQRSPKMENHGAVPPSKRVKGQRRYSNSDYDDGMNSPTHSYYDEPKLYSRSSHDSYDTNRSAGSLHSTERPLREIHSSENLSNSGRKYLVDAHRTSETRYTSRERSHHSTNSRHSSGTRESRNHVDQPPASSNHRFNGNERSSLSPESRHSVDKVVTQAASKSKARKNSPSPSVPERERKVEKKGEGSSRSGQDRASDSKTQKKRDKNRGKENEGKDKNRGKGNEKDKSSNSNSSSQKLKHYSKDELIEAMTDIHNGTTLLEASEKYNVSSSTLSRRYKDWKKKNAPDETPVRLQKHYELKLIGLVKYMNEITPLTCNQVKMFAWAIDSIIGDKVFGCEVPSNGWWTDFKNRNPDMGNFLRQYDFIKANQMKFDCFSFNAMTDYLVPVQEIIEAFELNDEPDHFWSCSEYSLSLLTDPEHCLTPSRVRYLDDQTFAAEGGDLTSIMFAGSASGKKAPPFIILKDSVLSDDATKEGPAGAFYDKSSNGFIDSTLLLKWFEHVFLPQCPKNRSVDKPVILLLNSNFVLAPQTMLEMAQSENVILLSLMPHLHHACQPMDAPIVKGFGNSLRESLKRELDNSKGKFNKDHLPKLIKEPFEVGMTTDLVVDGFQICGVFPLTVNVDQNKYLELQSLLNLDSIPSLLKTESQLGKVLRELKNMMEKSQLKMKSLNNDISFIKKRMSTREDFDSKIIVRLPVKTKDEFACIGEMIEDANEKEKLVQWLINKTGNQSNLAVANILKATLAEEFCKYINYSGNNGKISLKNSWLFDILHNVLYKAGIKLSATEVKSHFSNHIKKIYDAEFQRMRRSRGTNQDNTERLNKAVPGPLPSDPWLRPGDEAGLVGDDDW